MDMDMVLGGRRCRYGTMVGKVDCVWDLWCHSVHAGHGAFPGAVEHMFRESPVSPTVGCVAHLSQSWEDFLGASRGIRGCVKRVGMV